ncbi:hypothetical protein [Thermoplasma sp.]|nr:hypothetical protein [Thermoplasma sp.]
MLLRKYAVDLRGRPAQWMQAGSSVKRRSHADPMEIGNRRRGLGRT